MTATLRQFSFDFLSWVDQTHTLEPKSQDYYTRGTAMLLKSHLSEIRLDKMSNHLCETASFPGGAANANTALRTLRRILAKAKDMDVIAAVPKIKLRKEWGRSIAMSRADAALIASHMHGTPKDAFQILRATGMRPGECFALRWEYVDFARAIYRNPKGKTVAARRAIPLLHESLTVLQRRHAEAGSPREGWVFKTFSCSGHLGSIQKAFTDARDAAGLPKGMVIYCARHGYATDAAPLISLKGLMDILGHSSAQTALRYQHPSTEDLVAKLAQIPCAAMALGSSSTQTQTGTASATSTS
jgi:integrase